MMPEIRYYVVSDGQGPNTTRARCQFRPDLMAAPVREFDLRSRQRNAKRASQRLMAVEPRDRLRYIKQGMRHARIVGRKRARAIFVTPLVGTLQAGVPITLTQRWLGHGGAPSPRDFGDLQADDWVEALEIAGKEFTS